MGIVVVEGKDISPKEIRNDKGWLEVRAKHKKNTTPVNETKPAAQEAATLNKEETYTRRAARNLRRHGMASKKPNLLVDDIKVIVCPKDGFSTATHCAARIGDGIRNAAGLRQKETRGDTFRVNERQNIIAVTISSEERARRYCAISKLHMGDKEYEASAHAAAPENTTKGIIHGIPVEDTLEDIERHLVNEHNPTLLHAKRMGQTANAIIVFEGSKVKTFRCQRERHKGDPGPAPILAPALGRGTLSHSPRLEAEKAPDLGPGAGLSRGWAPRRGELPETETPMGNPKLPRAAEVKLPQGHVHGSGLPLLKGSGAMKF
ncbi:hypothetical protein HPB50_001591 [Hyalomma asiaticum]|uniref:Uncharacterized protein n=1 Tax=Hyalomma asiaticum TaxID=266040 RepID=A0ACB7SJS6_HYAAI|nr:hypothetical protein HPB50_001591 [Hyalomma asiaticum]